MTRKYKMECGNKWGVGRKIMRGEIQIFSLQSRRENKRINGTKV